MRAKLPIRLIYGTFTGLIIGIFLGSYIYTLTFDFVIPPGNYKDPTGADFAKLLAEQEMQFRYWVALAVSFGIFSTVVGAVLAVASFDAWVRQAVHGLLTAVALTVAITAVCAWALGEVPFNYPKTATATCVDIARVYLIPIACIVGPIFGVLFSRIRERCSHASGNNRSVA